MTVYVQWYGKVLEGELLEGEWQGMKRVRIPLDGCHPVALFTPGHVYSTPADAMEKEFDPKDAKHKKFEVTTSAKQPQKDLVSDYIAAVYRDDAIKRFKEQHWDQEQNHLRTDALDKFYQLWCSFHRYKVGVDLAVPGGDWSSKITLPSHTEEPAPVAVEAPAIKCELPVHSETVKEKRTMRCWRCEHLDYDHIRQRQEQSLPGEHFCGLHGRAPVDPDGPQQNLDHKGSCGFFPRKEAKQLSLLFD